ncbi:hypothetical protein [Pseudomonas putida]|uniref:hypothetical protein n=1 Tax=Pseudomonas putida TaxID=303 RepID=UPI0024E1512A|nr:hypothetical protein [Pseudomonas putida]HDS0963681.1 hypothetical protein [Pseudomonas putida]HDS0988941.1 hypothetical protein [Pseudomonas putida]
MSNSLYGNTDAITGKRTETERLKIQNCPTKAWINCHLKQDSHSMLTVFFKHSGDSKVISIDRTAALTAPAFKENHHAHRP